MRQCFFIPETLPGLNEIIAQRLKFYTIQSKKGRKVRISQYDTLKKRIEKLICRIIRLSGIHPMGFIDASFLWIEPNRKRDKDNISVGKKFIFDALVKSGILSGDGWKQVNSISDEFQVNKSNPGVLVTLEESKNVSRKTSKDHRKEKTVEGIQVYR